MKRNLAKILAFTIFLFCIILMNVLGVSAAKEGNYTYIIENDEAIITEASTNLWGTVTIPSTLGGYPVTSITGYSASGSWHGAFDICNRVTNLIIPSSITFIGKSAFEGCSRLKSITVPFVGATKDGGENSHFGYIFGASSYIYNNDYLPQSLKTVTITGGTSIEKYAFYDCNGLTNIDIADSILNIEIDAFRFCSNLVYNIYGNANYLGNAQNPYHALINVNSLPLSIHSATKVIATKAISACYDLESIVLPEGLMGIGTGAFYLCHELSSITIPNSVTSIGLLAFSECNKLKSITFLSSSTEIWDDWGTLPETATIYGYGGSTAQAYAEKYNRKFELIEDEPEVVYGDANNDGSVNGQDLLLLRKYLANFDYTTNTSTIEVDHGADANGDGAVNGQDLLLLRKYLANYDYTTNMSTIVLGPVV